MRFMVIERFRGGDPHPVAERFRREGRMLPDDVVYEASWIDAAHARCFQVMSAPGRDALEPWLARWRDIIEFDVIDLIDPSEYWAGLAQGLP